MLQDSFAFAGFQFPRTLPLTRGRLAERLKRWQAAGRVRVAGPYYVAPKPRDHAGAAFYLDSDFMPGLRWQWADDIIRLRHTGWHTDPQSDGDTIRGLVFRLPAGRGFLAAWSLGEHMCGFLDSSTVYPDETGAAYAADSMAESAADEERDYQTARQAGQQWADIGEQIAATRKEALQILAERRQVKGVEAPALCAAIRSKVESLLEDIREAREEREKLANGDADHLWFYPGEKRLREAFNEGAGATVLA